MKTVEKVGGCLLLAVAPNGARKTKTDHQQIPLSINEIGEAAKTCLAAGASMIHLHVRDSHEGHSLSVGLYKQAIAEIQRATDNSIFIQVTSEAVGKYTAEEQFMMIHKLKPVSVSIGIREIKGLDEIEIYEHFSKMRENNIAPQLILYNQFDLSLYIDWLKNGVIPGKTYPILMVIGKQHVQGSFDNEILRPDFIDKLPVKSWMICAFGKNEYQAGKLAADLGGNIRIGFENNCLLDDGSTASTNTELISQMIRHLKTRDIRLANLEQTNEMMRPDW